MCVAGGIFSILGAIKNWNWFFLWPPAPIVVCLLSRRGARVFYFGIGLFVIVGGIMAGMGLIE